jgi:S1-C subfamily serine protease
MFFLVHIRLIALVFWVLALIAPASAQTVQRKSKSLRTPAPPTVPAPTENQSDTYILRQSTPKGWVWVTQTIDLTQQLGGEENIMTLDGEPLPSMQRRRVTLGLILDDEGHIITRLIDVSPSKPPLDISVKALGFRPVPAKFLGMDTVTGFCVLKALDSSLKSAALSVPNPLPARLNIRLYGFHPNQALNPGAALVALSPRTNFYSGQVVKASGDFRFNSSNQIYYLASPHLTPVQDCSLIMDKGDSVFGLAVYDTGSQDNHLVYPISKIQSISQAVVKSHKSLAHGWLGATGMDAAATISTPMYKTSNEDLGVRVTAVAPDSPAEIAGVLAKDILLSVNDRRVQTYAQLASIIRQIPAESDVVLKVKRGGEYKFLKARLIPAPATEPEQQLFAFARRLETMEEELKAMAPTDPNRQKLESRVGMMRVFVGMVTRPAPPEIRLRVFYGFEVQSLTGQLMNYFAVTNGLLVSSVTENNKAARSGLLVGDVIIKAGDTQVDNLSSLLSALDNNSTSESIEITVSRRRVQSKIYFLR